MSDCLVRVRADQSRLTYTLRRSKTAVGSGMISQVMERYFTSSKDTVLIEELCEAAIAP